VNVMKLNLTTTFVYMIEMLRKLNILYDHPLI